MVKLTVRDRESIQEAVRRFRKLVERSGIKKEMRRREYYEKPSETKLTANRNPVDMLFIILPFKYSLDAPQGNRHIK